jgi:hypothetical protein
MLTSQGTGVAAKCAVMCLCKACATRAAKGSELRYLDIRQRNGVVKVSSWRHQAASASSSLCLLGTLCERHFPMGGLAKKSLRSMTIFGGNPATPLNIADLKEKSRDVCYHRH